MNESEIVHKAFVELICITNKNASHLDKDNILWKIIKDKWVGKRSVWTYDYEACWLEDTTPENVKSWWCGENADYSEILRKDSIIF